MRFRSVALPFALVLGGLAQGADAQGVVDRESPVRLAQEQPAPPPSGGMSAMKRRTRDFATVCVAEQGSASGWCAAYLMGVADALTSFGSGGHKGGLCDVDYTPAQLSKLYLAWIRDNPQMLDIDMVGTAMLALRSRWPCR